MAMEYGLEEEKLGKAYDAQLMRRLLLYVRPYRTLFIVAIVLSLSVTAAELALPYLTKIAIDSFMVPPLPYDQAVSGLLGLATLFMGVLLARLLFSFAQVYILQYTGQRVMFDMRIQIFSHLMRLPVRFFDRNPVGRLVTRATNDVAAINEMYSAILVHLFRDVFLILGIFAIMFQLNWRLALLILLLMPLLAWITFEFRMRAREAFREVRRKLAKLNAYLAENISGMRITQLFVREGRSFEGFSRINFEEYEANMRQITIFAVFQPLIYLVSALATALILWYGGFGFLRDLFTLGALVAFLSYVEMLFQPIRDLSEKYNILQGAMASSERIFMLLDEPEERYSGRTLAGVQGRVEFRDVWFSYAPDPKDESDWVLKGVSFVVEPGERVAIVGPTGSGKSTIISLLLRLYEIQRGQILLDGMDIRELDLGSLRAQMAVVLQDVFLFSGDILGNIRLQAEEIPKKRAMEAARFVQAEGFIKELPQEYHTEVKERGATLSVGQRQLLAFARAVAFDPKILILDEATANIDSKTESLIQSSIERILQGRTSIVIAHRLSTIRRSDKILVLHRGRLVEEGTHEELLAKRGLYYALYTLQFSETGPRERPEHARIKREED
jgi:ATP-binding cassette subfamily B protein